MSCVKFNGLCQLNKPVRALDEVQKRTVRMPVRCSIIEDTTVAQHPHQFMENGKTIEGHPCLKCTKEINGSKCKAMLVM